jgi:hypothetical protein
MNILPKTRQAGWGNEPSLTANILLQPLTELTPPTRQAVHAINQSNQGIPTEGKAQYS